MSIKMKKTVAIVGLGLIGGSLALALKDKFTVWGCSRKRATEEYALECGMIDEIRGTDNLRGADCVIACTPLKVLRDTVKEIYSAVGDSALITDVGSVKGMLEGLPGRLVGGHPMAGNERSGIEAAENGLFRGAYYCIVPYKNSCDEDVEFVTQIAKTVESIPVTLSPEEHDRLAARYSHAPHMCAYALSESMIDDSATIAGSGFSDSTRIALSDADFWTEVFKLNRRNTLDALDGYMLELGKMKKLLENEDYDALKVELNKARNKRIGLGDKDK